MFVDVDKQRCIGCGSCVDDCVARNLVVKDAVARVKGSCILCGHCVAICPTEAVSIPSYAMEEVEDAAPLGTLDAGTLLRVIKSRRSIRDYRACPVEQEKINLVLQAGRYTATAKNKQESCFVVVQDQLEGLKDKVWGGVERLIALSPDEKPRWVKAYKGFNRNRLAENSEDYLFRNAPAVLFVASDRADDAGLAAQNMELMANSLGLGVLYNGYLCHAAEQIPEVREFLDIGQKPLQISMLLGYPRVTYPRTAPRLPGCFVVK